MEPCSIFKHFDNTLQLLGEAFSYELLSKQYSELLPNNPYKYLRSGLHYYLLNLTPFFTAEWFTDAIIELFGYPCYTLT